MANLLIIKDIAETKNISLKDVAIKLGITPDGLQKIIKRNSTTTETLEKIANVLGVHVGVFFEGCPASSQLIKGNGNAASIYGDVTAGVIADKEKEIEHLKALLEEKERVIIEKERTIQILINK